MSKHTSGSWKVEKELTSRTGEWLIAVDAGDRGRGIAIAETVPATGKELANARLIAAAPELLEVLQYLANRDFGASGWDDSMDRIALSARIAIAKATGGRN